MNERIKTRRVAFVEGSVITTLANKADARQWKSAPRGWTVHMDDGSIFLCPLDVCAVKPRIGEVVELGYVGDTWKIAAIRIGGRDYRKE